MRALLIWAALAALSPAAPRAQDGATAAAPGTVVATRAIRARELIGPGDVALNPGASPGAVAALDDAVGMEARVSLYAGWPVRASDIVPPALVERNGLVGLIFRRGGLEIATEGRALGRAGLGDRVRVMNLDSRLTVTGFVTGPNLVEVK